MVPDCRISRVIAENNRPVYCNYGEDQGRGRASGFAGILAKEGAPATDGSEKEISDGGFSRTGL